MGAFFSELAKNLAQRWIGLLLIPGALFTTVAGISVRLGQRHALDPIRLDHAAADVAAAIARQSGGSQAVLIIGVLLAAAGTGLVVQALAGLTRRLWLGPWPRPLNSVQCSLVANRRARWHRRVDQRRRLQQDHPQAARTADQQREINTAADRVNRFALAEPGRPTWMGDRVHAVDQIARDRYGLDLAFAWPRLWLVLPDIVRTEITAADAAFAAAVAAGTWAWPYALLGTVWWPAALIAIGVGATGWARARAAITDLAALSEAALDLHGRTLATALGVAVPDTTGPLTITEGEQLTALIRKGR